MVQIPLRRAHRLRAIILASPTKKLRPQPTERTPTAWHTNDEYKNAEASDEASASSTVANVSENRVLPIPTSSSLVNSNPTFITVFVSCLEMCPSDPVMIPASPVDSRKPPRPARTRNHRASAARTRHKFNMRLSGSNGGRCAHELWSTSSMCSETSRRSWTKLPEVVKQVTFP
jgi:hypothetical protein